MLDNEEWAVTRNEIGMAFMDHFRVVYCEDSMPLGVNLSHLLTPFISYEDNQNL